ncbi:MAG: hypothetical protein WC437_00120 [Patescibacteria group bacterium]
MAKILLKEQEHCAGCGKYLEPGERATVVIADEEDEEKVYCRDCK